MDSLLLALPEPHRYGNTTLRKFDSVTDALLKVFTFVSPFFHRVSTYGISEYAIIFDLSP